MKFLKYLVIFAFGFLVAKLFYEQKPKTNPKEELEIISNEVKNLSKLVVSSGNFAEIYSFSDSKKYFYDYIQFQKKAILSVTAKVEVGYNLSKLDIQIDSINKEIIINKIPKEEVVISPDIKYFDIQESQFNSFSHNELNKINEKAIAKIQQTSAIDTLKLKAKNRLFEELSKIYQLSKIYGWKVVDKTSEIYFKKTDL